MLAGCHPSRRRLVIGTYLSYDYVLGFLFSRRSLPPWNPDGFAAMILVVLVASTVGIASMYIQCRNLHRTFYGNKMEEEQPVSSLDVRAVQTTLREGHQQSRESLTAEVKSMRTIQREVKAKLVGLEQLVQKYTELQEQKEQQQLGKNHTGQEEDYRPKKE
jgi:hypothetical protein